MNAPSLYHEILKQRCISNLKIKHFYFYLCLSKGFELRYPIFMTKLNYNIQIKNQRMSYYLLAPLLKSLTFSLVISSDFRGSLSISINLSATSRFSIQQVLLKNISLNQLLYQLLNQLLNHIKLVHKNFNQFIDGISTSHETRIALSPFYQKYKIHLKLFYSRVTTAFLDEEICNN